ncbi:hypothetical protein LBMAG42_34830 [Deltaproteobacteria bacterium]|nr:hypothetical protein LBMAG42_34830 [Deltaproteobacteria bacterium]
MDALITGDLGFSQRDDVEAHVSGCLLCRRRVVEAHEVYAASAPALRSLDHVRGSTRGLTAPSGAVATMGAPPAQPTPSRASLPFIPPGTGPAETHEVGRPPPKKAGTPSVNPDSAPEPPPLPPPPPRATPSAIKSATAAAAAEVGAAHVAPAPAPGRYRWLLPAAVVVVATLAVKFFSVPPPENPAGAPTDGVVLEVHRLTNEGKKERLLDGTTGRPGDVLGFKIRLGKPAYALLIAIPPSGPPFAIWPPRIDASAPLALTSGAQSIEASVELPEGAGPSRLVAFACPSPLTAGQLLTSATLAIPGAVPKFMPECQQSVVTLRQIAAPK